MQAPDLQSVTRKTEKWFARHQRPLPWRAAYEPYHVAPYQDAFSGTPGQRGEEVKHELDHGGEEPKYEMPQPTVVEVDARGQERPAELMGDVGRRV